MITQMNSIVIDIETVADDSIPQNLLESIFEDVHQDSRMTDPIKIQADIGKKKCKVASEFALSPLTGKICCFALKHGEEEIVTTASKDEKEVLISIAATLSSFNYTFDTLVGFNSKSFDIPFIRTRCAINNIPLKLLHLDGSKYSQESHFDIRSALTNFDSYGKGTLEEWCLRFGIITIKSQVASKDIQEQYDLGNLHTIAQKCKQDVDMTYQLFNKVKSYF